MAETLTILSERVDDMPVWVAQRDRMGVQLLLDAHVPTHGNWVGLSLGWVTVGWVTQILSEASHRLNHVEPWAKQRLHTLRRCTGQPLHPLAVGDDRRAGVLEALSDDGHWQACEGALTQQLLRVYDLRPERVRLESPTANGHWRVTEDGLFQFGHRKDHRPDLPQVKSMRSALDPLGMPVATDVVPGQRADDPLSVPAITRVRESLGRRGLLYVGACQMAALETRAFLQAGGDASRCPLAQAQRPPAVLERALLPVWTGQQPLSRITRVTASGTRAHIADGYERLESLTRAVEGQALTWTERRLVVRSRPLAHAGETALRARVTKARAAVAALNARGRGNPRFTAPPALQAAGAAIRTRYRVHGLLAVPYTDRVHQHRLRRYGSRPATVQVERDVRVQAVVERPAVAVAIGRLGWRVYATNAPSDQLPLAQAVLAYRSQYLVERDMGRLNGHPVSVTPMVPGARGPCHRLDPTPVGRLAGPHPAGVCDPPAPGRRPDGAGGTVCRQPDAGNGPPHDRAPAHTR